MPALRTQARIVIVLGILSVIAMGLSHLALTDIAHGEGDVSQEWRVVQVSAAVFLLFTGSSLATLARFLKTMP